MRSIAAAVNSPRWLALQLDLRGLHASEVPQLIDSQLKPQKVVRRLSEEDKDDEDEDDDSSDDSDDSAVGGEAALLLLPAARSHLEQLGLEVEQQGPGALVVHLRK